MQQYFVEGLFVPRKSLKKANKAVEPYARVVWANSSDEAIRIAGQELAGGQWVEGPTVSDTTEEQRMRQMGAPELPGLGSRKPGGAKKPRKRRGRLISLLVAILIPGSLGAARPAQAGSQDLSSVYLPMVLGAVPGQAPVFKWQYGGCYSSWCETGWYSSPGRGRPGREWHVEVIGGQYTFTILNGTDGSLVKPCRYDR